MPKLSHVAVRGKVRMVDVGRKKVTRRQAVARGRVRLSRAAFGLVAPNRVAKGDVLAAAQLAGIQAAKKTSELVPLCHPIPLDGIDVSLQLDARSLRVLIEARARARAVTGVEMEALAAVVVAGLTVYDMVKAADREAVIGEVRLIEKRGGKGG